MKRLLLIALLLPLVLMPSPAAGEGSAFYLKDGDRVVFYGDSITEQRLYTTFVEEYVLTRFPTMKVTFVHSGVGGDKVSGGWAGPIDVRLRRDVLDYAPTVVTVMLGMNDAGYKPFDAATFATYTSGYSSLVATLRKGAPGARLTLVEPSPFDEVTRPVEIQGGYNTVLRRYGQFVADLARREGAAVADLNGPVVAALERANRLDPSLSRVIIPDRVHPGAAGHWLMAEALLRAWGAPSIVTSVEIDAARARVVRSENTKVSDLTGDAAALTWTQLDGALPLPLRPFDDASVDLVVRASDIVDALDREPLRVTGLPAGRYRLTIDGGEVGTFTDHDLGDAINLSLMRTPMSQQALTVHWATQDHNEIHASRFKLLVNRADVPNVDAAIAALDALETKAVRDQRNNAQPKPHRFELRRVGP